MEGIEIERSSGSRLLSKAAIETVRKVAKIFPEVREYLRADPPEHAVPIIFKGKGKVRN